MLNMVSKLNITYEYLEPSKNWSFEAAKVHVVRWADAKANDIYSTHVRADWKTP
jgi:hypothetical protein